MARISLVLLFVSLIPVYPGCGQTQVKPTAATVYVVNEDDDSVTVIDGAAGAVIATVPVGKWPHYVCLSPDGTRALVTNGESNSISVIDSATNRVVSVIEGVGSDPQQIAILPSGKYAYVPCYDTDNVHVIDLEAARTIAAIPVGESPQSIAVSADGARVYVVSLHDEKAAVIDTATNRVAATFTVGEGACGIAVSPDGQRLYLGGHGAGMWMGRGEKNRDVRVMSAATFEPLALARCGVMPVGVRLSRDGRQAYVVSHGSGELHIVDTATNRATAVRVGSDCRDLAVSADGNWVYVSNRGDDTVSVVDVAARKAVATIRTGRGPVGIAVK